MNFPIIDAHQHFWQLSRGDYGWLTRDFEAIYRDFMPADLLPQLRRTGVTRTVLVQAAPTVAETEFLLALAERHDFIAGVVGWVDMASARGLADLRRLAGHAKLKSIRPMIQDIEDPDWMLRPELAPTFEALIEADLAFDALITPRHLAPLARLLERFPGLRLVVDHGAKPAIARDGLDEWADGLTAIARFPNAYCKLSGLLTEAGERTDADSLRPYLQHLLASFGPTRLMWGSDWPVLNLAGEYQGWLALVRDFLAPLPAGQQAAILGANAQHFYRLS